MSALLRPLALLAAIVAIAALAAGFVVASVAPTSAAWTDQNHASALASAGTWSTSTNDCVAMGKNGKPVKGGKCTVTGVRFDQWSDGTNTVRDYYISVDMTAGSAYPAVTVDLSAASGSGKWSWAKAATVPTNQFTLPSGYACSELPVLRANGPTNWGSTYSFWVRVVEDRTIGLGSTRNCA